LPEGPEIRRTADRVTAVLAGKSLEEVWFGLPRLVRFSEEVVGSCVERVESRGKALLIRFDLDLSLYSHNQLYGVWYLRKRGEMPNTGRSLRVALHISAKPVSVVQARISCAGDGFGCFRTCWTAPMQDKKLRPDREQLRLSVRARRKLRSIPASHHGLVSSSSPDQVVPGTVAHNRATVIHKARSKRINDLCKTEECPETAKPA
jgi:hypothetical protein